MPIEPKPEHEHEHEHDMKALSEIFQISDCRYKCK